MAQPWLWVALTLLSLVGAATSTAITRIPLTYVFDWDLITKLPVRVSFNHSKVFSTSPTEQLFLLGLNLSVSIASFPQHQAEDGVEIGLKYPSDFIGAMAASFGLGYEQVQLGKEDYLEAIIFDDNYVESRDVWLDGESLRVHVKYNFGDDYTIADKPCRLIDGSEVYFEEYLIREALNKITKENQINFRFYEDNHSIVLTGSLANMPKLTLVRGDYIFKLSLAGPIIHYIPAIRNLQRVTLVGYKALYEFNKFKFSESGEIIFKRTSQIFQLYIFIVYFVLLTLFLVFINRKNLFDSGQFVKHILKWAFLKDRVSRIEVLKSELE